MQYGSEIREVNISGKLLRRLLLSDLRISFCGVADWYLFCLFVMPTYFGVRLGFFDLTAFRLFEVLLLVGILKNQKRQTDFIRLFKSCPNNIFIFSYMFVVVYTNLIHPSINTIFYWITNGLLVIYCTAYLIIYEYGIEGFLGKLRKFAWILGIISPLELVAGRPPFAIFDTLNKIGDASRMRFGSVRIAGNCTTANGYALYLMILFPIMCYDWEKKRIDLGKNKWLLILLAVNIFLTGSRLTIGTLVLGFLLCFLMQQRSQMQAVLGTLAVAVPILLLLFILFQDTGIVRSILRIFFSAVDEVLNTNFAVQYGAAADTLYNSSYYRELLWKNTIGGDWLNPWLGRGGNYSFGMYIEGYNIASCDNFYVGQYITYAWPGVITWLLMSASFLAQAVRSWVRKKRILLWVIIVSIICYFIGLWYLDQLQTFPIMMSFFGMIYAVSLNDKISGN